MVYRNNTGTLGAGLISVCLETRWLGHVGGFYVPGCYCTVLILFIETPFFCLASPVLSIILDMYEVLKLIYLGLHPNPSATVSIS